MTDIQALRAQLRDSRPRPAARVSSGGGVPFWAVAAVAAVVGFGIVLLTPRFFTTQRTAALPAFQEAASRPPAAEDTPVSAPEPQAAIQQAPAPLPKPALAQSAAAQPASAAVSRYAGKTPEQVVRTSDAICEQRSLAVRNGVQPPPRSPAPVRNAQGKPVAEDPGHKVTAADEKLHCLLTEAPARFCAPNQKRKAAADVINYFKGIEYTNAAVAVAAKVAALTPDASRSPNGDVPAVLNKATVDPRVVEAIEGLMRAGYLTKANREEIGANVPRELKERFARIIGSTPPCPKPPWWSAWL